MAVESTALQPDCQTATDGQRFITYTGQCAQRVHCPVYGVPRELTRQCADIGWMGWPLPRQRVAHHAGCANAAGLSRPAIPGGLKSGRHKPCANNWSSTRSRWFAAGVSTASATAISPRLVVTTPFRVPFRPVAREFLRLLSRPYHQFRFGKQLISAPKYRTQSLLAGEFASQCKQSPQGALLQREERLSVARGALLFRGRRCLLVAMRRPACFRRGACYVSES